MNSPDISREVEPWEMNEALLISSLRQHELTEQAEQAEETAHESEDRYRTLFDLGPVAVYSCDGAGLIQQFNRRAAELWGREPALGDTAERFCGSFKLFYPDGRAMPHDQCPMAEVLSGKIAEASDTEVLIERPDGSRATALVNIRSLKNLNGEITGAINCFSDITARKRAEDALHASERRYRRLFEAAQDGVLILNSRTARIIEANPFLCKLLGYAPSDFWGKELWEIGLFHDKAANEAAVRELQQKGYLRYEHLPLETATGRQVDVEVVANIYEEDCQPVIQCNIRDITARSLLEEKTREQARSLADLGRRKDEFLAMLSHELRNPLAPIRNAIQLLRLQQDRTEIQREAHGMIERQVGQLARLVDDLLEVSRVSTGRIHLQEVALDLRGVVAGAVEASRSQCDQKRQSIEIALPDEPLWVHGDFIRLEQVLVNLLTNACKYTDRGGHVWVGLAREGDQAVLRVRDDGIGIPSELLPLIFDLFTQADKSLDRSEGGLGIGLALVQSLVHLHRGTVGALSTPGQGTEFIVKLPVVSAPQASFVLPAAVAEEPASSLKVLVVDDNVDAAKGLAMLLRAYGHNARTAHEAAGAMQAALEFLPQVVLLDIGLPAISGYQVAKWFREEPTVKDALLVALTGYGQESDKQRSKAAGFDHHLVKPVDFAQVQNILTQVAQSPGPA